MQRSPGLLVLSFALVGPFGCTGKRPVPELPPPTVSVAKPVVKKVTDSQDFTGRTVAIYNVDVRARVTGYLMEVKFKEGDIVQKDDLLYVIDERPYKASLDKAKGEVKRLEGQKMKVDIEVDRYTKLVAKGAASQQELDTYKGNQAENLGSLAAAIAQADYADLNLHFCRISSPITGQISRTEFNIGNLINQDNTLLTTIVSIDPMYVYFDVDERSMLTIQKRVREGKLKGRNETELPVFVGLAIDDDFPHEGVIDFVNNKVDPLTGSITVRGKFPNPKRVLTPGLFCKVRVPIGDPHDAVLVSERAIGTDQGRKFVYVVGADDKIEYREVTLGAVHFGLRVVASGLKPDEVIVVDGLQRVRPNATVKTDKIDMPVPGK